VQVSSEAPVVEEMAKVQELHPIEQSLHSVAVGPEPVGQMQEPLEIIYPIMGQVKQTVN
jgi:hypothetical protein